MRRIAAAGLALALAGCGLNFEFGRKVSNEELILRDETFAQLVLGLGASVAAPLLTLLLLLTMGHTPLLGWGTLWQLVVLSVGGAVATPICFGLFGWLQLTLVHRGDTASSFRLDREIRRGK